jgi:hypothetical protein
MGWGGPYYYRSRRVAGRVVNEYVGVGYVAQVAAETDAAARAERARVNQMMRAERETQRQVVEEDLHTDLRENHALHFPAEGGF